MDNRREPRVIDSEAEIASAMKRARKKGAAASKVIFLIGAGCSITAGIPGAVEIARRMVKQVANELGHRAEDVDHVDAYRALIENRQIDLCLTGDPGAVPSDATIDWYRVYDD